MKPKRLEKPEDYYQRIMMSDFKSVKGQPYAADNSVLGIPKTELYPFNINFTWESRSITVSLVNGEDVLQLANVFAKMLANAGIEYTIEEQSNE